MGPITTKVIRDVTPGEQRIEDYFAKCEAGRRNLDRPCYAPSFHCTTHDCSIDVCWSAGRCSAIYALNK